MSSRALLGRFMLTATCLLSLLNHPDVFQEAQEGLDRVVAPGLSPDFDDGTELVLIAIPRCLHHENEDEHYLVPGPPIRSCFDRHGMTVSLLRFLETIVADRSVEGPLRTVSGSDDPFALVDAFAFSAIWIAVASSIAVFDIKKSMEDPLTDTSLVW
ncbi:hypothetical protein NLJ89_g6694 [Agrocybe chaxingu]|uniref:Uncharacterized protein n=1 Tax=Agrocybe chaxingu TaxID=84603 RepID=A0A9W8MUE1_9AGAR|nr:hypothetical protein NLJ89_g6694 [Agrocybe chaxingu]